MSDKAQVDLAQAVKRIRENMPAMLELIQLEARQTRAKFLALVEQGFSASEALELCRKL